MSEPTTGKGAMSANDIERIVNALQSARGAQISVQDPRVSSVQNWILAGVGSGILVVGGWLINSVNKLNSTMTEVVTTNRYFQKQIEDNTRDIRENEHRISALERGK